MKLRKLRSLRGGSGSQQQQQQQGLNGNKNTVLADLESIRGLFNEKEKELAMAVRKVEDLTHQLEDLRTGRVSSHYPQQIVELERLRRELAYRKQLAEQQNQMIAQQRAQLAVGRDEISRIDSRVLELQERLERKRMMNQQLANQVLELILSAFDLRDGKSRIVTLMVSVSGKKKKIMKNFGGCTIFLKLHFPPKRRRAFFQFLG